MEIQNRDDETEEAQATAEYILRCYLLEQVRKRMEADGVSTEGLEMGPDDVEEVLEHLVEGDEAIIDDGEVHGFFRRLLDQHRERMATLERNASAMAR